MNAREKYILALLSWRRVAEPLKNLKLLQELNEAADALPVGDLVFDQVHAYLDWREQRELLAASVVSGFIARGSEGNQSDAREALRIADLILAESRGQ